MRLSLKPFSGRIKTKSEYRASVKKLSDMIDRRDALTKAENSESLVSAVMKGTRALSKSMIVRLHEGLGIDYADLLSGVEKESAYRKVAMF